MASKYGARRCFYIAFAVEDDKQSSIVVGKYDNLSTLQRCIEEGGVGGKSSEMSTVVKKNGGGKWRQGAFWIKKVSYEEWEAAVVNTAKFDEICVNFELEQQFYIVFAVEDDKQSSIVVGEYDNFKSIHKRTHEGGVGGSAANLLKVVKKSGGGKWRQGVFWIKEVAHEEYKAAVVNTAKFDEICVNFELEQ